MTEQLAHFSPVELWCLFDQLLAMISEQKGVQAKSSGLWIIRIKMIIESQVMPVVKNPLVSAGDVGDRGLGQQDSLEEGMATHASILAWRIPWTEEPSRVVCRVAKSQTELKQLGMHSHKLNNIIRGISIHRNGSQELTLGSINIMNMKLNSTIKEAGGGDTSEVRRNV